MEIEDDVAHFHLVSLLQERAEQARSAPKRIRTRMSILAATAEEMESTGYGGLTIDAVVERAGVARGTFYLYFGNRADAAIAVMRSFQAAMHHYRPRGGRRRPAEESIYRMNLFYVRSYAKNATVLMGGEALMRDKPELALTRDFRNHRWARAILRDLCKRSDSPPSLLEDRGALLAVRTVIAMADELLRETYIFRSPYLAAVARSEEEVAEALTFVWYRAIFGCNPPGLPALLPRTDQPARAIAAAADRLVPLKQGTRP